MPSSETNPTTAEWTADAASAPVSLPTMVSSTDLFDGELFGDELIDIYNNSVEEGVELQDGIPTLEPPATKDSEADHDHPGAQVAVAAAAMDDGLGAFRPSTSFNDLTTLMQPEAENKTAPPVVPATDGASAPKSTKKRGAPASSESPAAKRKTSVRKKPASPKKQSSPPAKKNVVVAEKVSSAAVPLVVTPTGTTGEEEAATVAAVEAAAAAAVAASFPALPELGSAKALTKTTASPGVTLAMKAEGGSPEAVPSSSKTPGAAPAAPGAAPKAANKPAGPASGATAAAAPGGTDSQFKSIAQQAVSNLIMNAGTSRSSTKGVSKKETVESDGKKVDTSTAHIKALTGNNWVAACAGNGNNASAAGPATPTPVTSSPAPVATTTTAAASASASEKNNPNSNANRARRQNLTPDERARQNRDRNREHARNTRLRKKAYVEELKRTLTELVAQRDAADLEKRQTAQRELEQREVRFRVIEEFLKLRGRNEASYTRWAAILEDGFVLTVPSTSLYKNTEGGEVAGFEQKFKTVETVMAESTVFSGFLQSLRGDSEGAVTMVFDCDRKNFFMDGCNAVLQWTASTDGGKCDVQLKGLIRGKFSPASNKLMTADLSFDSGSLASQIQTRNSGSAGDEVDAAAAQADAILDSLEINHVHLNVVVPSDVSVTNNSSASVESSDEAEEKHVAVPSGGDDLGMTTRRVHRRD